ncbi:hypothetical protein Xmir_03844 [Xenorhabdus miraniensis]|uniref:Uncharacterized protein n=1 Tax=Xenorhabdus miraniensis TaxID=351674 RepID=A0A2D0JKN1_9GAMM|nr:hypothetical protein Xmir_03844 [Xenorhabdus miraniensis]
MRLVERLASPANFKHVIYIIDIQCNLFVW